MYKQKTCKSRISGDLHSIISMAKYKSKQFSVDCKMQDLLKFSDIIYGRLSGNIDLYLVHCHIYPLYNFIEI